MKEIVVQENAQRLDKFIVEKENMSRMAVQRLIDEGNILVNEKKQKSSYKVQTGDVILINIPEVKEIGLKEQNIPLDIIYEDTDIIVVNKAKGMVVHPAAR